MKKIFFFLLVPLLFLGAGCTQTTNEATTAVNDANTPTAPSVSTNTSEVASDTGLTFETFESENGDFSYTLSWNTKQITKSTTHNELSSEHAPSFNIPGGGTVSVMTDLIDVPGYTMDKFIKDNYFDGEGDWPNSEPTPSSAGTASPIYYFTEPVELSGRCIVQYVVIKGRNEALALHMEDCAGNDMKSSEGFASLYSEAVITIK